MDRSGWLKSCRVFAAASRRAWGVQRAMRGCVSAHVGALSTPDRVRPLDRHVPRILQTYLHAGKLSPDRTYGQVRRLSRCFTLSLSRSRYSFSSSFLSFSSVVVQHPRLATHPFHPLCSFLHRATIVIKTRFTDYSVVISLSLSLFLISVFFHVLDKMNFVFLRGCPRADSLGSVNFSTVSY